MTPHDAIILLIASRYSSSCDYISHKPNAHRRRYALNIHFKHFIDGISNFITNVNARRSNMNFSIIRAVRNDLFRVVKLAVRSLLLPTLFIIIPFLIYYFTTKALNITRSNFLQAIPVYEFPGMIIANLYYLKKKLSNTHIENQFILPFLIIVAALYGGMEITRVFVRISEVDAASGEPIIIILGWATLVIGLIVSFACACFHTIPGVRRD